MKNVSTCVKHAMKSTCEVIKALARTLALTSWVDTGKRIVRTDTGTPLLLVIRNAALFVKMKMPRSAAQNLPKL